MSYLIFRYRGFELSDVRENKTSRVWRVHLLPAPEPRELMVLPTDSTASDNLPGYATYTVVELATLLQCSTRHIHRMVDAREIPGLVRIGRLVRFSRRVIHEWIDSRTNSSNRRSREP